MEFFSSGLPLLLLATMGPFSEGAAVISPCHAHWMYSNNYCYKFFLEALSWLEAEAKCQEEEEEAHLVSIQDSHEAVVVERLIKAHKYYSYVWIGMFGDKKELWWIDDSESDYAAWGPGQPIYSDDFDYLCVSLYPKKGKWKWEVADCDIPQAYICKYEL